MRCLLGVTVVVLAIAPGCAEETPPPPPPLAPVSAPQSIPSQADADAAAEKRIDGSNEDAELERLRREVEADETEPDT